MPTVDRKQRRIDRGLVTLYFEMPGELREGLRVIAVAEDRTISYVLRRAIRTEIARTGHETKVGAA